MKIAGKTVLITGGASGIGKIMGRICLEKGASNLVIWDLNLENIKRTEVELGLNTKNSKNSKNITAEPEIKQRMETKQNPETELNRKPTTEQNPATERNPEASRIHSYIVNCADAEAVALTYSKVKEEVGEVDVLINCAGIVRGNNTFDKQTVKDINLTMDVNATAPMLVAIQALPDMIRRDSGCVCNIASAAGMLGVPKMSVYCASKWAVIGWTESMRIELKMAGSKVKVMSVAPYFINTGMFDGVQSKIFPILKPEKVAAKVITAIEKGKSFKGIPFPFHFIRFWQGVLPLSLFDFIFGKCFGVYSVMDHFTGRKKAAESVPQSGNMEGQSGNIKTKSLSLRRHIQKAS